MVRTIENTWVFRIVPIQNLEIILKEGMYCKQAGKSTNGFVSIGSSEIISERDSRKVKCYPETEVNAYVPFYFSVRTPMLYNIITGHGVPAYPQKDIVYVCCKLTDLATKDFQWCYTDGNAAKKISRFGNDLELLLNRIDWRSVDTKDFRDENEDGDEDRIRKKHAEFLVKDYVPKEYIQKIVVLNDAKKTEVLSIFEKLGIDYIEVLVNPKQKFYFL